MLLFQLLAKPEHASALGAGEQVGPQLGGIPAVHPTSASSPPIAGLISPARPWGNLELIATQIEPPDEFIAPPEIINPQPVWRFERYTKEQVVQLLYQAPLSARQRMQVARETKWTSTATDTTLEPPVDLVRHLTPPARAIIYTALSRCDGNPYQQTPYTFNVDGFDRWFMDSGLPSGTVATIRDLLYQRGGSLCFSDPDLVGAGLKMPERQRLLKTLLRQPTLILQLHVPGRANVDQLVKYWGKGGRARDVRPVLESLAKAPGGQSINVTELLPPLVRPLVYTYPSPPSATNSIQLNCYWTSFNFLSAKADDSLHDLTQCRSRLATDYVPVTGGLEFGDVLMLSRPDGTIIHAVVYIADQVVFTKNGKHFRNPWIFMQLEDVLAHYPSETPLRVQAYRLKDS